MTRVLGSLFPVPESVLGVSRHSLALLFEAAAKGTLILLLAMVLTLLLRRSSAAARHLVWTLALLAMLLLPIFSLSLPAWKAPAILSALVGTEVEPAIVGREEYTAVLPNPSIRESPTVWRFARLTDDIGGYLPWATGILSLWVMGLTLVAIRVAVGEVRVRRLVRRSRPFESAQASLIVENVRSRLRLTRHVKLRISTETGIPFTWGGFRPALVLPEGVCEWSQKQLNFVLAHELAHVSRYDHLTQRPAQVACALFWFHPLVWFAAFEMRKERERACDDLVMSLDPRVTDYAEFLLVIARTLRRSGDAWLTSVATGQISQLEVRMKALLDLQLGHSPLSRSRALLAAALAVVLVLPMAAIHATARKATGNIAGTVHDPSGAVIPGANITALNLETHDRISAYTGDDGSFEFPAIPVGRYQLEASKPGFAYQRGAELELDPSGKLHEDMVMDVGAVSEEIVVRGHVPEEETHVPPPTPRRVRVGGLVQAAKLVNHVAPVYPATAEKRGMEGTVILRAVIGTNGQMLSLSPFNDVDPDLMGAAMEAVRQWQYQPTLLNGIPVEVVTTITVVFRLDK